MKKMLTNLDVYNKRVLVRVDFNVPLKNGEIVSEKRILESLPTIKYLLANNARIILCSHLGRPEGEVKQELSLKPVFERLQKLLPNVKMQFCEDVLSENTSKIINCLIGGQIAMLENIRFYKGEENNDEEFAKTLANLCDYFVLDAFACAHRKHASTFGIIKYKPSVFGFLINKELLAFEKVLKNAEKPVVTILGGAKITDKIALTDNLLNNTDILLIGGGMCFTYLKALKAQVGKSLVDESKVDYCYQIIKNAIQKNIKIVLPVDFICSNQLSSDAVPYICKMGEIPDEFMGLDIGPKTVKMFSKIIKKAKTIIWNGPMGAYEYNQFSNGSKGIAIAVAKNKKAYSIVGGGDVVSCLEKFGCSEFISHISTGGGASLKLLEGKSLPCIEEIRNQVITQE